MYNLEEMDKFLEKYQFPRLDQKEIKNMNWKITNYKIETVIKSSNKQNQDQKTLQANCIKHSKG